MRCAVSRSELPVRGWSINVRSRETLTAGSVAMGREYRARGIGGTYPDSMESVDVVIRSVDAKDVHDPQKLASIWVRSTDLRDGCAEPTRVSRAVDGIRRRIELDDARALVAECAGDIVGFVLCAVQGDVLEVFYLAVDPEMWGRGIATCLLHAVDTHAGSVGCDTCELWVIDDNERAVGVYEGAGWLRTDMTQMDTASGRLERKLFHRTTDSRDHVRSR
ncbi:hypothetical protein CH294_21755 [Rhodococcus sp. 14-2483-1-1]|nr:hypothetical protein CH294_21755 [Rhodococcus sp. 14-2483-1-1]